MEIILLAHLIRNRCSWSLDVIRIQIPLGSWFGEKYYVRYHLHGR